jgi:hypothetical protein
VAGTWWVILHMQSSTWCVAVSRAFRSFVRLDDEFNLLWARANLFTVSYGKAAAIG